MKKQLIIGFLIILLLVGLSGCEEDRNKEITSNLIGTWNSINDDTSITFRSNGEYESTNNIIYDGGTYEVRGNTLVCSIPINNQETERSFDFSFSKDKTILTITDTYEQNASFIKI